MRAELLSGHYFSGEPHWFVRAVVAAPAERERQNAFFFEREDGLLTWNGIEQDVRILQAVITLLRQIFSAEPLLTKLTAGHIGQIEEKIAQSPLFLEMRSDNIIVSPRHGKTRPYVHTIDVLRELMLEENSSIEDKVVVAVAATYHDVGKSMAARYGSEPELRQLMSRAPGSEAPLNDSYRRHEDVSAWALSTLLNLLSTLDSDDEVLTAPLSPASVESLLFLVIKHHFYQEWIERRADKMAFFMLLLRFGASAQSVFKLFDQLSLADLRSVNADANIRYEAMQRQKSRVISRGFSVAQLGAFTQ